MSNEKLEQQIKERRAQNEKMLAHLYSIKRADAKRGKESNLLFNAHFCEYQCIFGIDALIAALEIETKNNQ
jgi:hypothetical protein